MITQAEADRLLALLKLPKLGNSVALPAPGASSNVPLVSADGQEDFFLDMHRGAINLHKGKFQTRALHSVPLARLDFGGGGHRNPDGIEVASPHMHVYREGFGLRWAQPIAASTAAGDPMLAYWPLFQTTCNISPSLQLSSALV